jgi:hypothetical protein
LFENLQEDDALSSESASKENENSTGLERRSGLVWADGFAGLGGACQLTLWTTICAPLNEDSRYSFATVLPYLSRLRFVLSRVVFAGLLRGRCDGPLALLELLGLWRLRHLDQLLYDNSLMLQTLARY